MHRNAIPTTYTETREALNDRDSRKIANNTTLVDLGDGSIGLRLHSTCVVTFNADGSLVLATGGWQTVTTKDRINRVIRAHGWTLYAKAREWFLTHRDGGTLHFREQFVIPAAAPREPRREDHCTHPGQDWCECDWCRHLRAKAKPALDATVHHDGSSLFLVRPLNDARREWLGEHTHGQWFGPSLVVEHRFVTDLVAGLRDAGFVVEAG